MDEYIYNLYESKKQLELAEQYISLYESHTASQRFFEDVNGSNQEMANQSENALVRAVKAIQKMIANIIDKVVTFAQTVFMDKDEKDRFLKFKEALAANPEFKGKRITIKSFREINAKYQEAIKILDNGIAQAEKTKSDNIDQITDAICGKANNIVKGIRDSAATVFSVDAALRVAENNKFAAKYIDKMLREEGRIMKTIENELGEKRAKDFKKKIHNSTKVISMHRLKVKLLGQWHNSIAGGLQQTLTDFEQLFSSNTDLKSNIDRVKQVRIVDDVIGTVNKKTGTNFKKRDAIDIPVNAAKKQVSKQVKRAASVGKKAIGTVREII